MKVGILHHDLEFAEEEIQRVFQKKGHKSYLVDVRNAEVSDFKGSDLVLNRVYASVANRDYSSIPRTLALLKKLENKNIFCVNSYRTSLFDYDKYFASIEMKKAGINNPKSFLIEETKGLEKLSKHLVKVLGVPMIIKRNTGGRGKDVSRVNSLEEVYDDLRNKFDLANNENYFGGFVAQEFVKSVRDHDCRMGVINGKSAFSYGRSLVSLNGENAWLASTSNGSIEKPYEANVNEKEIGIKASSLIGADFNELDIMFTEEGPFVIENNPTPNYFNNKEDKERINAFVNEIEEKLRK